MTTKYNKLDLSLINFSDPVDNVYIPSQRICHIRYNNDALSIQTPYINPDKQSGIPSINKFYKDDKSRAFYKLTFYSGDNQFKDLLMQIDNIASNLNNKVLEKRNKYQYIPLVRCNDDENKDPYAKLKLILDKSNKPLVKVFNNISGIRKLVEIASLNELSDLVKNARMRFIIKFQKLYIMKNAFNGNKKMFGITLNITHIEIIKNEIINQIDENSEDEKIEGKKITRIKRNISDSDD
jgi:hypothetical protein